MVSQGTVKPLSKSRVQMPLKSSSTLGLGDRGSGRRQVKRNLTYSFHSHQLTKLSNGIFNPKVLVLKKKKISPNLNLNT